MKRLSKALSAAGVASRRAAEELIFSGRVQVNGQTIIVPQTLVSWDADEIRVDGELVKGEEKKTSYILNKPKNVLCTNVRPGKKTIVLDLFPDKQERLFTVGRLDRDTTGLLIVTNDGTLAHQIIHPSANIEKEYLVKTTYEITAEHLEKLSEGARVDDKWVRPISVRKVRKGTFSICVREGKKHEVRIIAERANLTVLELKRIRIGGLVLGNLGEGEYRPLTENDKRVLFEKSSRKKIPARV